MNRSGWARITPATIDASVQTSSDFAAKPKIRVNRNCTDSIKSTCAQVSTACGLSVEMSLHCCKNCVQSIIWP